MDTTIKLNNKTAVIYARYSSDSQSEQSIDGQVRVITDYAKRNNIPIIDSYIDRAISGLREDRPEFQRMLEDAKNKNFGYVLVYKYDRFSRDRMVSLMSKRKLRELGVKVISVTEYISDDPQGILMESLIDGYSEYYSAELSQKVRRGNRESRIKGLYTGGMVIYGYKIENKKYVIVPEEAEIVKKIFTDAANGITYDNICKELNSKGITKKGKEFKSGAVFKMIHNKKYIGIVETNGEVFDNIVPPIIDKELFEKAGNKMNSNQHRGAKYSAKVDYLLSGKAICGYCGEKIIADSGRNRHGEKFYYYKCKSIKTKHKSCELKPYRKEVLEDLVYRSIKTAILESNMMDKIVDLLCKSYNSTVTEDSMLTLNEKALAKNKKEIDNLMNAIKAGIFSDTIKDELSKLEEEKAKLEIENVKLKAKNKNKMTPEIALRFLESLMDLDDDSFSKKKRLIERFVKRVILYNDKIMLELYSMEGVAVEKNDNSSSNNTPCSDLTNHCPPF